MSGRLVLLLPLLATACARSDPQPVPLFEPPTDLATLASVSGPANADTVVIFVQGGPFANLRPWLADSLPGMAGRTRVAVHQPWTLTPSLLEDTARVGPAEAAELNLAALAMLDRVVQHYVERDAAVCVVGHSYGALLSLLWVATRDATVPVQILAGRLALPEVVWTNFRDGALWWFPDGTTPEPVPGTAPAERIVPMRVQADVGRPRYMELLDGRDLSGLTVVYGDRDRLVGALTTAEVAFLERHGARVVHLAGGGHRAAFEEEHATALGDVFRCRRPAQPR